MKWFSNKALVIMTVGLLVVAGVMLVRLAPLNRLSFAQAIDRTVAFFHYLVAPNSFRTKIYDRYDSGTPYPGSGEVRVSKPDRLLVIGQGEGAMMEEVPFEGQEQVDELLGQGHQVEPLRANPEYLLYTVGVFQRWEELIALEEGEDEEDLPEARGRLLILGDPTDGAKVYTFHVVAKPVANDEVVSSDTVPTRVDVEKPGFLWGMNRIETVGFANELSGEALDDLIQVGDVVIVTPTPPYPGLATTDENDVPYAQVVTVRRTRVPKL